MTATTAPIGSTGQLLDGVDVSGTFRETVVVADPNDRTKVAPVDSVVGLSVNVASTVPQTVNVTVTSFPAAVGQTTMPFSVPVVIASNQSPVTINVVSSAAIGVSTFPAIGISSLPATFPGLNISTFSAGSLGVSSFGTAISISSIPAVGVSSLPAVFPGLNISTFSAGSIGVSSLPATLPGINISTFSAGGIGISSIPAVGVSSFGTAIAVSTIPAVGVSSQVAIGVSSLPATFPGLNVSTFSAGSIGVSSLPATFPGINVSTFSAGSIGVSSIPAVGVSSMPGVNISSFTVGSIPVTQTSSSSGGGLSVSRIVQNLNTTNSTVAKASPGQVYGWNVSNTSTQCYMSLFNSSSSAQISTAPLVAKIALQASSVANTIFQVPLSFSTGIYYALTALQVAGDNTAISASTVTVNLYYA